MNSSERLHRCYFHQEVDRPGVYSRSGFPHNDSSYDRLKAYLEAHSELKRGWNGRAFESSYSVERFTEPYSEDFRLDVTVMHTPAGEFRSSRYTSLKGQPGMRHEYFLKTREDAERYLSLPIPNFSGDVASFFSAVREVDTRGIVDVSLGYNPAAVVAELFGSETFALMTATDRDVVHALCDRARRIAEERIRFLLARGIGPYFSMLGQEYVTPPLHGPKDFYDFNVRYDKPIVDLIHNAGGAIHIHCHGSLGKVLKGFVDLGADVLHPIEAPPMGDVTPSQAKDSLGEAVCIEGNIQIADMYDRTPDEIREQTRRLIETAFGEHKNLILSPSASPYIRGAGEKCFPQYKAMIDTVLAYDG